MFCDISNAYDRVCHKDILCKLKYYGISDKLIRWVENYLSDRTQKVVLGGYSSTLRSTNSGVLQGSVLGPILFLLYINDISTHLDNTVIRLFADDTSLYIIADNDILTSANSLTHDLGKIKQWSDMWAVEFNPNKTDNLDFGRRSVSHSKVKFGTDGPAVENIETHTNLGIKFQNVENTYS